jgi:hypothetical protein
MLATTFCDPPLLAGEVSALNLFRFLPAEIFPEAARAKPPTPAVEGPTAPPRVVPGSAGAMGIAPSGNNNSGGKGKKKGKGKGKGSGKLSIFSLG